LSARRILALFLLCTPCLAQRLQVLKQIDLPHPYYFREMYLPQLTTGPSAAAWMPDSSGLVYSMAGSLWRQSLDSTEATELVAGPGYDYQPDCSPDGAWVVFAKYNQDAVELWALDLKAGAAKPLTHNGAVNLEPRFSPDSNRIAFVSTSGTGHFHIFTADFSDGSLSNIQQLTAENKSSLPRYYYSVFDHEISPVWSRDGKEILFISNRGHLYGTGGLWRTKAEPGAEAREVHVEETTWRARPDISPDGHRIVYSSYTGRPWHQLWTLNADGGNPIPISYGDFDNTNPRWSPDGSKIAFISNRGGNTSLWVQQIPGGAQTEIVARDRKYLAPTGHLLIRVEDETGAPTAARISVDAADGRAYAPADAWMQADDSFDRSQRSFEQHYYDATRSAQITLPAGDAHIQVMKGFEHLVERATVTINAGETNNLIIRLQTTGLPHDDTSRWVSGDVHVHMNYAGTYRNTPAHLVEQAAAEDVPFVENLIVNKEQRIPDIAYFSPDRDPASTANNQLFHAQEYHTSYWGHLGLLHLTHNFLLPGYSGYAQTAMASIVPTNADIADLAHAQHGLVGYAHPFDAYPDPVRDPSLTDELPVDVALGKVDYLEVVGFSDHKSTAEVWYHLLNCGFHLPAAAGTDAMANYASLRGPVGLNRVYAKVATGSLDHEAFLAAIRAGHTFVTNGPLLGFTLEGKGPGDDLDAPPAAKLHVWLRSVVPVNHLEFVCNGKVMHSFKVNEGGTNSDADETISLKQSGWCVLRAWNDQPRDPVLDIYPYATTSPVYVTVPGAPLSSAPDAAYFEAWIARLTQAALLNQDYNTPAEKTAVLDLLDRALKVYEQLK
jgi:TolB protein